MYIQGCILVLRLIFLPPPLFQNHIFSPYHGLKTGVFSPKPIESSYFCPRGGGQNEKYTPQQFIEKTQKKFAVCDSV